MPVSRGRAGEILDTVVVGAARSVFSAYGLANVEFQSLDAEQCQRSVISSGSSDERVFIGMIPFGSGRHGGRIALDCTDEVLGRRAVVGGGAEALDWLCELSNQILGCMKGELARWGVDIDMGLPCHIRRDSRSLSRAGVRIQLGTELGQVAICLWVDAPIASMLPHLRDSPIDEVIPSELEGFIL